jgi:hypothetical protein
MTVEEHSETDQLVALFGTALAEDVPQPPVSAINAAEKTEQCVFYDGN